jgi:hypothetical protein
MTGVAILFLVIAIVVVWGGLVASILYLRAHPTEDLPEDDEVGVLGQAGGGGPDDRA